MKTVLLCLMGTAMVMSLAIAAPATSGQRSSDNSWACSGLPDNSELQTLLAEAPNTGGSAGGLFSGTLMWAAVVNRDGQLCAAVTSTSDPQEVWPGSQAIAKAKAYTANAFSNDSVPLSTALLYTFSQPGHSLFGLNNSNPFNAYALAPPWGSGEGMGLIAGGIITFGGGVPLYKNGKIIGGLGVGGDTACTDHEIAKRVRTLAVLDPAGGSSVDDIHYSSVDGASVFTHPLCLNTYRNGTFIGNELPSTGY